MNIKEKLSSPDLIGFLYSNIEIDPNKSYISGNFFSAVIYDYFNKTDIKSSFSTSDIIYIDFRVFLEDDTHFNFQKVYLDIKNDCLRFGEEFVYFLESNQLDIALNSNSPFISNTLLSCICELYILNKNNFKTSYFDYTKIINFIKNSKIDNTIFKHSLTKEEEVFFADLFCGLEIKNINIKDQFNLNVTYFKLEKNNEDNLENIDNPCFEQYKIFTRSKKKIKDEWLKIFKYGVVIDIIKYYSLWNIYLNKLPTHYDYTEELETLNNFLSNHRFTVHHFNCSLSEQLERLRAITKYVNEKGIIVIKFLEDSTIEYIPDGNNSTYYRWLVNEYSKYENSNREIIVEPLPISDKYLGWQIIELYNRMLIVEESVANANCLARDKYYNKISEELRLFSVRRKTIRFTCEFRYVKNKNNKYNWILHQYSSYDNNDIEDFKILSEEEKESMQESLSMVLDYILKNLTKLYSPNKK